MQSIQLTLPLTADISGDETQQLMIKCWKSHIYSPHIKQNTDCRRKQLGFDGVVFHLYKIDTTYFIAICYVLQNITHGHEEMPQHNVVLLL